jgi:hypothetical protein
VFSSTGAAGFVGSEVTITAYCCTAPIEADRFTVPSTAIVGPGVEFPAGSLLTISQDIISSNVDVSNTAIDIRYTETAFAANGAFNGFGFDFSGLGSQRIVGVGLNPLSTFAAGSIGLSFDNDSVFYSGAGLSFTPDSRVLINVSVAPVPEPVSALLFLAGGAMVMVRARMRGQRSS